MAVGSGTNPFDDDSSDGLGGGGGRSGSGTRGGGGGSGDKNPFERGHDDGSGGGGGGGVGFRLPGDDDPSTERGGTGAHPAGDGYPDAAFDGDGSDDGEGGDGNGGGGEGNDPSAPVESSWQFLGDLPYRRVVLYRDVRWGRRRGPPRDGQTGGKGKRDDDDDPDPSDDAAAGTAIGLAAFPPPYLATQRRSGSGLLDETDVRNLLSTTTTTKVAGCPNGGPIAAITLPIAGYGSSAGGGRGVGLGGSGPGAGAGAAALSTTELRIMTASGIPLARVEFPPRSLALDSSSPSYSSADVLTIGFTDRCVLVVVMRDSLCLTYDLGGNAVLPPFRILPEDGTGTGGGRGSAGSSSIELMDATVYGGGVAVLTTAMGTAVAELLDEHDDPTYADGAHIAARRIYPEGYGGAGGSEAGGGGGGDGVFGSARSGPLPPHWAVVTPLPNTATHAQRAYHSYLALAVLPRTHTASRHPELFLSTSDNSVIVVDCATGELTDVDCRARIASPIVAMSFAPNGRFLACFTQSSILTVISSTFETKVLDFDTSEGSRTPPRDMKWCGEDSVVLHWKNLGVLMVGPYGDWLRFPYENVDNLHIIPEIDCCRVVTDTSTEILQRVPPATAELFRVGSIEPSAMLLDASDDFEAGSPSSDEAARAITKTGLLVDAIETCTEAATREFDVPTQKRLLRAASYGMHFSYKDQSQDGRKTMMGGPTITLMSGDSGVSNCPSNIKPSPEAIKFVAAARKVRILNALRDPSAGFTLTSSQFDAITPTGIVARLIAMRRPALASSICSFLSLDESVQAFARASRAAAFVISDKGQTDAQTAEAAIKILSEDTTRRGGGTVPPALNRGAYATVALAANRAGRDGVAKLLLTLETSPADKVPALISIGSYADAAAVAVAARDTDLIFLCLMEFEKSCMASTPDQKRAQSIFNQSLVTKFPPEAVNLFMAFLASNQDVKYMMNLLLRRERFVTAGSAMAKLALDTPKGRERNAMLREASRVFGLGKESAFQKSSTDEYIELLAEQERLRTAYGSHDVAPESSSVTTTIFSIIRYAGTKPREAHRLFADAEKLGKKFKVPEKRMWHVKVRAFAESGQWANLRNLADTRAKNPIGYKPFALAVIEGKQGVSEIMRYVDRVTLPEERYDLFCEAKLWKRAIDEAAKLNDPNRIMHVRSLCTSPDIQQLCDETASRMGA